MERPGTLSRRDALAVIGGSAAATFGTATARSAVRLDDGTVRVTVGYSRPGGERAARELARGVVHEFAFDAVTVRLAGDDVEALRRRDDVRYAERDAIYEIAEQTLPWGVDRVDAEVAHAGGDTGGGADVAVVDTGIDADHPDLADNLGEGAAFSGGAKHNQWQDDNGHGTHCAGTVAAIDNDTGVVGVAPDVTLHAVKVVAAPGAGLSSDVAKGIEWVAEQAYDVASMSIGGEHLESVGDACEYAADQGVTLVAAAGNEGPCTDCVLYPAAYPQVIAVSGTDRDDQLARQSSQGPEIDLAAPGQDIYSTYLGGYNTLSGTSMACPHVSGAAAQLAARGHSRGEIRQRLAETAEDVGLSRNESGSGLLDVAAALGHDTGETGGSDEPDESESESEEPSTSQADGSSATEEPTPTETSTPSGSTSGDESGGANGDGGGSGGASGGADVEGSGSDGTAQPTEKGAPARTPTGTVGTRTPRGTQTATPAGSAASPRSTPTPAGDGGAVGSVLRQMGDAVRTIGGSLRKALTGAFS